MKRKFDKAVSTTMAALVLASGTIVALPQDIMAKEDMEEIPYSVLKEAMEETSKKYQGYQITKVFLKENWNKTKNEGVAIQTNPKLDKAEMYGDVEKIKINGEEFDIKDGVFSYNQVAEGLVFEKEEAIKAAEKNDPISVEITFKDGSVIKSEDKLAQADEEEAEEVDVEEKVEEASGKEASKYKNLQGSVDSPVYSKLFILKTEPQIKSNENIKDITINGVTVKKELIYWSQSSDTFSSADESYIEAGEKESPIKVTINFTDGSSLSTEDLGKEVSKEEGEKPEASKIKVYDVEIKLMATDSQDPNKESMANKFLVHEGQVIEEDGQYFYAIGFGENAKFIKKLEVLEGTEFKEVEPENGLYKFSSKDKLDKKRATVRFDLEVPMGEELMKMTQKADVEFSKWEEAEKKEEGQNPSTDDTKKPENGEEKKPEGEKPKDPDKKPQRPEKEDTKKPEKESPQKPDKDMDKKPGNQDPQNPEKDMDKKPDQGGDKDSKDQTKKPDKVEPKKPEKDETKKPEKDEAKKPDQDNKNDPKKDESKKPQEDKHKKSKKEIKGKSLISNNKSKIKIEELKKPTPRTKVASLMDGKKADYHKFTDIRGHWAEGVIKYTVGKGYFVGTSETTYSPNTAITGGEFLTVLARRAKVNEAQYKKENSAKFYSASVAWGQEQRLMDGLSRRFDPENTLTREEMAIILNNYLMKIYNIRNIAREMEFKDQYKFSQEGKRAIDSLTAKGILVGVGEGKFSPETNFTRAEIAQVLYNLDQLK